MNSSLSLTLGVIGDLAAAVTSGVKPGDASFVVRESASKIDGAKGSDVYALADSVPNDFTYRPESAASQEQARQLTNILAGLGPNAVAELERRLPSALSHANDMAEVVEDLLALGRVNTTGPTANADALTALTAITEAFKSGGIRYYLEKANGRLSAVERAFVARTIIGDPHKSGLLAIATEALAMNPSLNHANVQRALEGALQNPSDPEGELSVATQAALRVLTAMARVPGGTAVEVNSDVALPGIVNEARAVCAVLQGTPELRAATLGAALRVAMYCDPYVVRTVLDRVATVPPSRSMMAALVDIAIRYGERYNQAAAGVRQQAMDVLNAVRTPGGRPFDNDTMTTLWQHIATNPDEEVVMNAVRILGMPDVIPFGAQAAARLAYLRVEFQYDRDADMPWMVRSLLNYAGFSAPNDVAALTHALKGKSPGTPKPPRSWSTFAYQGPWADPSSPAVRTNAIDTLAPAYPSAPGYWRGAEQVAEGLSKLEKEPMLDQLAQLLVAYGVNDRHPAIAERCRKLLDNYSGHIDIATLDTIQALAVPGDWAKAFLARHNYDSTRPVVSPVTQEQWRDNVVMSENPLVVGENLDALLAHVKAHGRFDAWVTNRLPEIERAIDGWRHSLGDWHENISKARSLLVALGNKTMQTSSPHIADDAGREYIAANHGRSRSSLQTLLANIDASIETLISYRGENSDRLPLTRGISDIAFADAAATSVTLRQARRDAVRKRDIVTALLDETAHAAWPDATPERVCMTKLEPTRDVVAIGGDCYIVAYPKGRFLVEADAKPRSIDVKETWQLIANAETDDVKIATL